MSEVKWSLGRRRFMAGFGSLLVATLSGRVAAAADPLSLSFSGQAFVCDVSGTTVVWCSGAMSIGMSDVDPATGEDWPILVSAHQANTPAIDTIIPAGWRAGSTVQIHFDNTTATANSNVTFNAVRFGSASVTPTWTAKSSGQASFVQADAGAAGVQVDMNTPAGVISSSLMVPAGMPGFPAFMRVLDQSNWGAPLDFVVSNHWANTPAIDTIISFGRLTGSAVQFHFDNTTATARSDVTVKSMTFNGTAVTPTWVSKPSGQATVARPADGVAADLQIVMDTPLGDIASAFAIPTGLANFPAYMKFSDPTAGNAPLDFVVSNHWANSPAVDSVFQNRTSYWNVGAQIAVHFDNTTACANANVTLSAITFGGVAATPSWSWTSKSSGQGAVTRSAAGGMAVTMDTPVGAVASTFAIPDNINGFPAILLAEVDDARTRAPILVSPHDVSHSFFNP